MAEEGKPITEQTTIDPSSSTTEGYVPVKKGYSPKAVAKEPVPPTGGTGVVSSSSTSTSDPSPAQESPRSSESDG